MNTIMMNPFFTSIVKANEPNLNMYFRLLSYCVNKMAINTEHCTRHNSKPDWLCQSTFVDTTILVGLISPNFPQKDK